jgi:hypothetical protein
VANRGRCYVDLSASDAAIARAARACAGSGGGAEEPTTPPAPPVGRDEDPED